ncbi:hypothetical protein AVEN_104872-1, partial [Araneus ventricosus]
GPKKFWSHFKKDKNNNHLPDKLYYNDKCFTKDIDIANAYADYFCSVFKPSSEYDSNDAVDFNGFGDFVGIDTITYDDVVVSIKELKSTSTIGIDNIPSFIIKGCAEFLDTGSIKRKPGQGRPRATTATEDRYLSIIARCNRGATTSQLSRDLYAATGTRVSRVTVSKRLHETWLFAKRPAVCVPLTSTNRRVRLAWCKEHRDWSRDQWATVLFTDESRFSLNTDSCRTFI